MIDMYDYQLIEIFVPIIEAGLIAQGITDVTILQSNQPVQQGVVSGRTAYFKKLYDHRYGLMDIEDSWNNLTNVETEATSQFYETTFQMQCLAIQDPSISNQLTAADIANAIIATLQSPSAVTAFVAAGISIYKITDVRNLVFLDDKNRHEYIPFFEFTLTHTQDFATQIAPVSGIVPGIFGI